MVRNKKSSASDYQKHKLFYTSIILLSLLLLNFYMETSILESRSRAAVNDAASVKLGTFEFPATATPGPLAPTNYYYPTIPPEGPLPIITPAIGGPQPPEGYYCIDDEDPDLCDDDDSHLVPKGAGGIAGSCGTVIANAHNLVEALPQIDKGTRDSLSKTVSSSCASTGPTTNYVSTHFVIDAYNLAGFFELSKTDPNHVSPTGLLNWWQSKPAGYEYIPYTPTVVEQYAAGQKNLTGCVMFLKTSSSYHIGIVNFLELYNSNGDGVISILQSGTSMYIDRFPVAGWNISNDSTNQTYTSGVTGFGCHL